MHFVLDTVRRQRRDRPAALASLLIGIGGATVGAALLAAGFALLAQLVAGLALVPLSAAAALFLIPARSWPGGGDDRRGWGGPDDGPGGGPSGGPHGPQTDVDWERFEQAFRAYAEAREPVSA